ncbi:leucine-rich repeat protein [Perkinsela sp. CCAP 1560/4]|nr:leucine-rich repeat protein [Perkinsela sp. CCAP 1560/4]|eukprot:KNH06219.1 leucine-rich repeat protein [Perkinsela sp. CCAP 1560/4]
MLFRLLAADLPAVARPDKASMSQQMLMEILVGSLACADAFRDTNGCFKDVSCWNGVDLDLDGNVSSIRWAYYVDSDQDSDEGGREYVEEEDRLTNTGGFVDFQWIPDTVTTFSLSDLNVQGSIDTTALPESLAYLQVDTNSLNGTFDTKALPRGLEEVRICRNKISGSLDMTQLPTALQAFYAACNCLCGSLDFSRLPDGLRSLSLVNNLFSGTIDLRHVPKCVEFIQLCGNKLRQSELCVATDLPHLFSLTLDKAITKKIVDESGKPVKAVTRPGGRTIEMRFRVL